MNDKATPAKRTVKVWMAISVEIDIDALEAEYGRTFTVAEARDDVKSCIPSIISQALYPELTNIVLNVTTTK